MIGIDIGTTQSKCARVETTGKPVPVLNERGKSSTPSALYIPESGETLFGEDAREQGYVDPQNFLSSFKLNLDSTESLLNGRNITPMDATALLVGYLKNCAEKALGREVTEVVATCPANFRDDSKAALLRAYEMNDIRVLKLLSEPMAAGFAYALDNSREGSKSLIYDFGGGTFDTSITEIQGSQLIVLGTEGVAKLGGNDFNKPLKTLLLAEIEKKFNEVPVQEDNALLFSEIDSKCESAKFSLNNRDKVPIVVGYKGSQVVVTITKEQYQKSVDDLIQQSLDALDRVIAGAGLSFSDIDNLLLVGGTSRFPYVQERVAKHTGLNAKLDVEPENAIAFGAALCAVAEMANEGRTATIRGQVIPSPELFARDVCAHGVGCCVIDGESGNGRLVNSVIIPKNTPIPCQKTECFFLEHENQTELCIEILQGAEKAERDSCLLIGELTLDNLPRESTKTKRIQIDYRFDGNGMIHATVLDKVSGRQQSVTVDYKKGVKPKDKPALV